jgi:CDP-glycerol glycerophosphotransferase
MRVVYQSFEGRYSDSPRALYESWVRQRPGDSHTWLADPAHLHGFPDGVATVPPSGRECVDALEGSDLLIANTHTDLDWDKRAGTRYLQTWHGTTLKRVHNDILWAPPGRLDRLSRDVARWDMLVSPNSVSTPLLRGAFDFSGEVLETGYPRNDVLSGPERGAIRDRVRAGLQIEPGTTLVLYAPTFRDDAVFSEGRPEIELGLDVESLLERLGEGYVLALRLHYLMSDRRPPQRGDRVRDVTYYPDVAELFLAADVMVTDYSSSMFDFAVTGKPLVFFTYDLDRFRDEVRGFYFDLEEYAPGPMVRSQEDLADALLDLPTSQPRHADRYQRFRQRFCHLDDGHAGQRVLDRLWSAELPAGPGGRDDSRR